MSPELEREIVELRKAGYSGGIIETKIGQNRITIGRVLRAAGIADTAYKADERYPLRCSKCHEWGHPSSSCPTGDALDRLDQAEGWVEPSGRRSVMPVGIFQQVKIAFSHQLPEDSIASNMSLTMGEVKRAFLAKTYDAYVAG